MSKRLLVAPTTLLLLLCGLVSCGDDTGTGVTEGPFPTPTPLEGVADCTYTANGDAAKDGIELPASRPVGVDRLTLYTSHGDIPMTFADSAPCTVNSFVSLAQQGYFDDTRCHRLVPGFVLQCGDPTASGRGGPGYSFPDELAGDETYPAGTLAMANAGPDTNGSQFFIVLDDAQLPPSYTVFGSVGSAGLEVALEIASMGTGADPETPAEDIVIEQVR